MAALSDYMRFTTYRGNHSKTIEIVDGELNEYPVVNLKELRFGTTVEVVPSEKYLGPIDLTTEIVEDYLRHMSYVLPDDVTVTFVYEKESSKEDKKGKKKSKPKLGTRVFKAQGLDAAVKYMSSSLEFAPINVSYSCDNYDLNIAFSYDRTLDDSAVTSFCNFVITREGGTHVTAATQAICAYFSREAKKQDPNSKYEITFDDCKRGLVLAINLGHVAPKFDGQHKGRVSNQEVTTDGRRGLINGLEKTCSMGSNPMLLKKIINYLRNIAKARQESHKIKGVSVKKNTSFLDDAKISKYYTVSNRNSSGYKELFLAEGD